MGAIEWGCPADDIIEPGKMMVRANAAGKIIDGVTIKQYGVSPDTMRLMGMLIVPRSATSAAINPTGNRNPRATKKMRRQRKVSPVRIIRKKSAVMNSITITAPMWPFQPAC